jgi:uncharacterized membrane protein
MIPLLLWAGLLAVVVWTVLRISAVGRHGGDDGTGGGPAEKMLRQRFASGEIEAEEHEERLRVLNESSRRKVSR